MNPSPKPTILFIYQSKSSFVREDLKILSGFSTVKEFRFPVFNSGSLITNLIKILFFFFYQLGWLFIHIWKAKAVYCWFSDYHSFLPTLIGRLWKKPIVVVLGGFDCIKMPHLDYGIFCSGWRKPLGSFVLHKATILLPVDESLIRTHEIARFWPDAHPNGVAHNLQSFHTPYHAVPTGYDPALWSMGPENRPDSVCTVASSNTVRNLKRKGIDLFIATAKELPQYTFTVVGLSDTMKKHVTEHFMPGNNVQFLPRQERTKLVEIYGRHSVYLQLSRAEGLPNVLCEAMMCGCIPVGSAVFGIPHGIGDAGYIADKPDPRHIATLVKKAIEQAPKMRSRARNRIIDNFPLQRRKGALYEVLTETGAVSLPAGG